MKYHLHIPKPCHENWHQMTPTERGRFCAVCKKDLYDFSQATDYQILNALRTDQNLCGRFRADQLNRDYVVAQNNPVKRWAVLLGITSFLTASVPVLSQNKDAGVEVVAEVAQNEAVSATGTTPEYITISGSVVDDTGLPLPGVNILIEETAIGTQTDFDGNYSIELPSLFFINEKKLVFSYVGFQKQELILKPGMEKMCLRMQQNENNVEMVVVTGNLKVKGVRGIFHRIGNLFRKKH